MGAVLRRLIELYAEAQGRYPRLTKTIEDVGKDEAGPYGPAIREVKDKVVEKGKEAYDTWEKGPQKVGEDYPFFPPGVFSPYPKAFEEQGDQGNLSWIDGGGRRGGDIPAEEIDKLVARVLGARPGESDGRGRRPFYFG